MAKVVVAGYDKMLASLVLGAKTAGHEVLGVMRIDRVKYSDFTLFFKDIFNPSYDYSFVRGQNLYDIKAKSVNSPEFIREIKRLKPDVILVGSWSEKFCEEILKLPKFGVINCHPSLLPRHRGANPYFWAIYSGDEKTGVTFHKMNEKFDSGEILMQAAFKIEPYMTGGALKNKASKVAELMVGELLSDLENNKIIPVVQDESKATYDNYPFLGIDEVNFDDLAQKIADKVRGLRPWAYCRCILADKVYKIKSAKVLEGEFGEFEAKNLIKADFKRKIFQIKCSNGAVEIHTF